MCEEHLRAAALEHLDRLQPEVGVLADVRVRVEEDERPGGAAAVARVERCAQLLVEGAGALAALVLPCLPRALVGALGLLLARAEPLAELDEGLPLGVLEVDAQAEEGQLPAAHCAAEGAGHEVRQRLELGAVAAPALLPRNRGHEHAVAAALQAGDVAHEDLGGKAALVDGERLPLLEDRPVRGGAEDDPAAQLLEEAGPQGAEAVRQQGARYSDNSSHEERV